MPPQTKIQLEQYLDTLPEMKEWYFVQSGDAKVFDHIPLQNRAPEIMENIQRVLQPETDNNYEQEYKSLQQAAAQGDFKIAFPHALGYLIICLKRDEVDILTEMRGIN